MRYKELLERIGKNQPCLVCHIVLSEIEKKGIHDFAYLIRQLAEKLWSNDDVTEDERIILNDKLATLVRMMGGDLNDVREKIETIIKEIDERIDLEENLKPIWIELREVITQSYSV